MKYRLKPGYKHYHFVDDKVGHVRLEPGEVVELTPTQAQSFADRFEAIGAGLKAEEPTPAAETGGADPGKGGSASGGEPDATKGGSADGGEKGSGKGKKG